MNHLEAFFRQESTETEYPYHSSFNDATGNLCQIRRMLCRLSNYSHPFITVRAIGQVTLFLGRLFYLLGWSMTNRIRAKRIIGSIIIIFLLPAVWITCFSFRLYLLTSITKTFLMGIIKFFLKWFYLTLSRFAKFMLFWQPILKVSMFRLHGWHLILQFFHLSHKILQNKLHGITCQPEILILLSKVLYVSVFLILCHTCTIIYRVAWVGFPTQQLSFCCNYILQIDHT